MGAVPDGRQAKELRRTAVVGLVFGLAAIGWLIGVAISIGS
jgi:hypothetical protein